MKQHFRFAVLPLFLLAFFANAQEVLHPLPTPLAKNDSALAETPTNSLATAVDSSLAVKKEHPQQIPVWPPVANMGVQEKQKKKTEEKKKEYNPEDYKKNLRTVVYLHPVPFIFGAARNMFMFSATIEVPMSLSNSVIIQPTIWQGSSDGYIPDVVKLVFLSKDEVKYENLRRKGGGIGLRHYVLDKGEGFYLQLISSAYYLSAGSISLKEDCEGGGCLKDDSRTYSLSTWTKVKGWIGELMFYAGATHKWQSISLSYEGGLGFGYDGTETYQMGYANKLVANFNLSVGIPLF